MEESGNSITVIVLLVMVVIAGFGWGFLAGSYTGAHAPAYSERSPDELGEPPEHFSKRNSQRRFFANAIEQLPNMPTVIWWNFSHRLWLPLLIGGLEVAAVIGGLVLKKVEKNLSQPYKSKGYRR